MQKNNISVVIICSNAINTIEKVIASALQLTEDVVVVDTGSTDGTIEKIMQTPARLTQIKWNGYGNAKNTGNALALHDWILSVDADEYLNDHLIESLKTADLSNMNYLFSMQRLNYLGNKPIHFGEWRNDVVLRLFNRNNATWDASLVHENLIIKNAAKTIKLQGVLHHYTTVSIEAYQLKLKKYASLIAEKYFAKGKESNMLKQYLSSAFNFIQNYILKAGFLDGKEGLQIALAHASYTFQKYKLLKEKYDQEN